MCPHANVLHLLSFPVDTSCTLPLLRPKPHRYPGCFFLPLPHPVCQEILLVLFSKQTENLTLFTTSAFHHFCGCFVADHHALRLVTACTFYRVLCVCSDSCGQQSCPLQMEVRSWDTLSQRHQCFPSLLSIKAQMGSPSPSPTPPSALLILHQPHWLSPLPPELLSDTCTELLTLSLVKPAPAFTAPSTSDAPYPTLVLFQSTYHLLTDGMMSLFSVLIALLTV